MGPGLMEPFNWDAARLFFEIIIAVLAGGNIIYSVLARRTQATKEELTKMDERAVKLKLRVAKIETELDHTPTRDALNALTAKFSDLHGDMKALNAKLEGIKDLQDVMRSQTTMIDRFLRESK
ncbi:MAG: hypothetical protein COA65_08960 [Rhodospirillaceae bacterium]|nr:MAG: hypothetical protein COA65_08960 [Rhodospirillaceae bacterium]